MNTYRIYTMQAATTGSLTTEQITNYDSEESACSIHEPLLVIAIVFLIAAY